MIFIFYLFCIYYKYYNKNFLFTEYYGKCVNIRYDLLTTCKLIGPFCPSLCASPYILLGLRLLQRCSLFQMYTASEVICFDVTFLIYPDHPRNNQISYVQN